MKLWTQSTDYNMPQDESDEEEEADPELDGADREALQAMLTGRAV